MNGLFDKEFGGMTMCKCCEGKNNFADVGIKIDTDRHRVYLCGGNSKPPEDEQFDFCPKCGTPLGEIKPLTAEQLRQMSGKPVFVIDKKRNETLWCIITTYKDNFGAEIAGCDHYWYEQKDYSTTWIAYDRELINKK